MKRPRITLLASMALAACLVFGATSTASATTRHRPLNARSMASTYMKSSLAGYAHVSRATLDSSYAGGCSYRSFATSHSVDPTSVVNAASRRAQGIVNHRVRSHGMSRGDARAFMKAFRGYCNRFFGPVLPPSTPTTGTPVPGYGCTGPWGAGSGITTPTPSVPTTPVSGYGCTGPWGAGSGITTPTPSVPTTPVSGYGCTGPWSGTATSTPTVPGPGCGGGC